MRKTILMIALLVALPSLLFAQEARRQGVTRSLQSSQTNGIFENDVDAASDVTRLMDMSGPLFFMTFDDVATLETGYYNTFGNVYGGLFYEGNILNRRDAENENVTTDPTLDGQNNIITIDTDSSPSESTTRGSDNLFDVTLGFGSFGVGFSLDQFRDYTENNNPRTDETVDASGNLIASTVVEDDDTNTENSLLPSVTVGTVLETGFGTLRPYVGVGVHFYKSDITTEFTSTVRDIGAGYAAYNGVNDVESFDRNVREVRNGYVGITPLVGAELDAGPWRFGFMYDLDLRLYNNDYDDATGAGKSVSGTAEWDSDVAYRRTAGNSAFATQETTTRSFTATEITYMEHEAEPYVEYRASSTNGLEWGAGFSVYTTILNQTGSRESGSIRTEVFNDPDGDSSNDFTRVTTTTNQGRESETRDITIDPIAWAGVRYEVIPNVLSLNGGATLTIPGFFRNYTEATTPGVTTEQTVTTFGDGSQVVTGSSELDDDFTETSSLTVDIESLVVGVSAGLTWNLTEAVALDLAMSTATNPTESTITPANTTIIDASLFTIQVVVSK